MSRVLIIGALGRIGQLLWSQLGQLYDLCGLDISTWLSHRDCVQLSAKALAAQDGFGGFGIYYGVSNNDRRFWGISDAQQNLASHLKTMRAPAALGRQHPASAHAWALPAGR